ncbi:MAG: GNAT family N-acetyltransferase [Acidobacteria bacterium]|nr:GNAT family N-acetyltransferase [Acidobacteriota bacterium]
MNETTFAPLETDRLLLRRFADRDLAPFLAYVNDPVVNGI